MSTPIDPQVSPLLAELADVARELNGTAVGRLLARAATAIAQARTDKARLDFLDSKNRPNLGWMGRESLTDRGYRLHQNPDAHQFLPRTAREGIDEAIRQEIAAGKKAGQP